MNQIGNSLCRDRIFAVSISYNTKNADKRFDLKRKTQVLYIGVAVLLAGLFNAMLLQKLLLKQEKRGQQNVESRLPTGDYLPDAENPLIRVVIKTDGFKQVTHSEVRLSAERGLDIVVKAMSDTKEQGDFTSANIKQQLAPGEILTLTPDHELFKHGSIRITPKFKDGDSQTETLFDASSTQISSDDNARITINSLTRGYGTPSYRGIMELYSTPEGIVIVNELPVEEYLCAVVPSEMPASYEAEALKCQAICARSYAYCQMLVYGYPEYYAHVDDSVSYQVYGNSKEQESTTSAVKETSGKKLWYQNQVVKTYYYSTSCGHSTSVEAWGTKLVDSNKYLKGVPICDEQGNAYERNLPWYKWEAIIAQETLENLIELNTGKEIGDLKSIAITKQGVGGIALEVTVVGTLKTITIDTENKIRAALGGSGYQITKQDGKVINSSKLLPSAFFTIEKNGKSYIIKGGGYGHGIGMSQNGANEIAKNGKTHEEILQIFYPGTQVQ